jgi:uncharacterized membrane protein YdfJ with MMPL/SSD domain
MDPNTLNWSRLYLAATLAGAGLGLLVLLGVAPQIPDQLTNWRRSVNDAVAMPLVLIGGAAVGFALTAIAHLGVRWQLRQRMKSDGGG